MAIKRSDLVIVMVGPKTHIAHGVLKEVKMAQNANKHIVQIIGYKNGEYTPVPGAGRPLSLELGKPEEVIELASKAKSMSVTTAEKARFVQDLTKELREENLAIFAGAGLSVPSGFVNWSELLKPIAEELELDIERESDRLDFSGAVSL